MTTATKTRRGVQTDASEARKHRIIEIIRRRGPITSWQIAKLEKISYSHVLQFLTAIDNEGSALLAEDDHGQVFILDREAL